MVTLIYTEDRQTASTHGPVILKNMAIEFFTAILYNVDSKQMKIYSKVYLKRPPESRGKGEGEVFEGSKKHKYLEFFQKER